MFGSAIRIKEFSRKATLVQSEHIITSFLMDFNTHLDLDRYKERIQKSKEENLFKWSFYSIDH